VPQIHLLVALVALTNRLRDGFVRVVAGLARDSGMHRQATEARSGLEGTVASRAVPSAEDLGLLAEDVAGVAVHRRPIEVDVRQRRLLLMALRANARVRGLELGDRRIVTVVTLNFLVEHVL
jgi:hypothetical protein